jgi:hypothetical protein
MFLDYSLVIFLPSLLALLPLYLVALVAQTCRPVMRHFALALSSLRSASLPSAVFARAYAARLFVSMEAVQCLRLASFIESRGSFGLDLRG